MFDSTFHEPVSSFPAVKLVQEPLPLEGPDWTTVGPTGRMSAMTEENDGSVVVVDGSNVAHAVEGKGARLENIRVVCRKLQEEGFRPVVLVDAKLRHEIDEPEEYESLVAKGMIRQAPAGTDADYFILSFAREFDARVVSNDRFRELAGGFPEIVESVIRFMVVEGEVVLEKRAGRR